MDVLTVEDLRVEVGRKRSRLPLYFAAAVYAAVAGAAAAHHEPWADEAQSWLLARDSGLLELWTRLLRYEGTPGLWQTLLHLLIRAGLPYAGLNWFSALLGTAAAAILLWRAPFPAAIRIALPFTFFLCYQYAVIARSYDLLPLLLFGCAALYGRAANRPRLFTTLLCLMAAVSIHGMVLAVSAGLSALVSSQERKRFTVYIACFAACLALLAVAARPAPDGTFIAGLNFSPDRFLQVSSSTFATAFTGEILSSLLVVALSIPLLWAGGGWWFFVLSSFLLCGIGSVVYSQVWHHGVLFLSWVFALWISWPAPAGRRLAEGVLILVAAFQCYWTMCSIGYDWTHAYSGSRAAAHALQSRDPGKKYYAVGFANVAIQPYFPHNIFANVNDGKPQAYWDWSARNHVNLDSLHLGESQPDYVIVGYKNEFERGIWNDSVRKSGYRAIAHFEGNTYWQTRVLEPESYDLFSRTGAP